MRCIFCDRAFEPGDVVLRVTLHRMAVNPATGKLFLGVTPLEDGTMQKLCCPTCPAQHGAPLALTGADRMDLHA